MNHWTPSQWDAIVRHARAERICAVGARVTASAPYIASHWHAERAMHAAIVRANARALGLLDVTP